MKEHLYNMSVATRHQFLIDKIMEHKPKTALEIGAGRGIIAIAISKLGVDVRAIDKNPKYIVEETEANQFLGGSVTFELGDVFRHVFTNKFDVVFSQGFIHHFPNGRLFELLRKYTCIGTWNIHSVPSEKHPAPPSRTKFFKKDEVERFLSCEQWSKLLRPFKPIVCDYSHDLEGVYSGKVIEGASICLSIRKI